MERFLARHSSRVVGTVSGFYRLLFRGTLRSISFVEGMDRFLASQRILYKDVAGFAARITTRLRAHAEAIAQHTGRALEYLRSSAIAKERPRSRDSDALWHQRGPGLYLPPHGQGGIT